MLYAISASDDREAIWTGDPAIDVKATGAEGIKAYRETLDESHLVLTGEPTRFIIGALDTMQAQRATLEAHRLAGDTEDSDTAGVIAMAHAYFRAGVRSIKSLAEEGDEHKAHPKRGLRDETIALLHPAIAPRVMLEIGLHIIQMTSEPSGDHRPVGTDEGK